MMMIDKYVVTTVLICLMANMMTSQIGLPHLDDKRNPSYKSLLKSAEENNTIALAVLYTDDVPVNVLPRISAADSIKRKYNLVTDVINPYRQISYPLITRIRPFSNPLWVTVLPDNIIIGASSQISTDEELDLFVKTSKDIAAVYDQAKEALDEDDDNVAAQKDMISAMSMMYESKKIRRTLNKFLKKIETPSDEDLDYIISVAEKCACSSKLEDFIDDREGQVIEKIGLQRYLSIKQRFINDDLNEKQLLEPYYVWQKYEQELGIYADSLYRLFAIGYFSTAIDGKETMVTESMDFLTYYPDTPWEVQDNLYLTILNNIKTTEDLEIMLDLISGQLFKEKTFRKLDFRAYILYQLGKKEEALKMLQEVTSLAAEQGIRYKSLLNNLN